MRLEGRSEWATFNGLADEANINGDRFLKFPDSLAEFMCPRCEALTIVDTSNDSLRCGKCRECVSKMCAVRSVWPILRFLDAQERRSIEKELVIGLLKKRIDQLINGEDVTDFDRFSVSLY